LRIKKSGGGYFKLWLVVRKEGRLPQKSKNFICVN